MNGAISGGHPSYENTVNVRKKEMQSEDVASEWCRICLAA